jgi:hypothetical protein
MSNRLYSDIKMKKDLWYKTPHALSWDDWESWRVNVRQQYPVQYFFREDVRLYFSIMWRRIEDFKYKIQCFFFPKHQEIRKAIPRTWADITSLVVDVNFAMILSFKKEADESFVNWDGTPQHRQFKNWLDSSAHWITVGKPNCESQANTLHPSHPLTDLQKSKSYEELYGELNKMEKLISETDSNILKQMIDYREYMWT